MKKVIIVNGSPRKNFNTAKLLKEAARGAEESGAKVEFFNLYDLNYKGCISCLMCKRKGVAQSGLCFFKDGLTPLLEKCLNAKAIDKHHASPMMSKIAELRNKYDLHMKVERYVEDTSGIPEQDKNFIKK